MKNKQGRLHLEDKSSNRDLAIESIDTIFVHQKLQNLHEDKILGIFKSDFQTLSLGAFKI